MSLEDKLIRVERSINIYNQNNVLVNEISIDNLSFDILKNIVAPKENDPLLYVGYELNVIQLEKLNSYLS